MDAMLGGKGDNCVNLLIRSVGNGLVLPSLFFEKAFSTRFSRNSNIYTNMNALCSIMILLY